MIRTSLEIKHFSQMDHVWWGALTLAGQHRYDHKFQKLREFCNVGRVKNTLEIGCGDGEFTKRLIRLENSKILATDLTQVLIKKAKKNLNEKNVSFKVDNAEKMKIKGSKYDLVCGISILHHLRFDKCLRECKRVLKEGGEIFFTEPNFTNPIIFASLKIPFLRKRMELSPDETAIKKREMLKLLHKIGFSEYGVENYDFLYPATPKPLISFVRKISNLFETLPVVREFSGSLIIWGRK